MKDIDIIIYKDFIAIIYYSIADELYYGRLIGISDSVTFEGESISEMKILMRVAVDDFLEICFEMNKNPHY